MKTSNRKDTHAWFKFNPRDWRGDIELQMCSLSAQGLWINMLCLLHDLPERGVLKASSGPITTPILARLLGYQVDEVERCIAELEERGVLSRQDDGTIYSRRMIRDEAAAEAHREAGRKGGRPRAINQSDNQTDNQNDNQRVNQKQEPKTKATSRTRDRARIQKSELRSQSTEQRKKSAPPTPPVRDEYPPPQQSETTRPAYIATLKLIEALNPAILMSLSTRGNLDHLVERHGADAVLTATREALQDDYVLEARHWPALRDRIGAALCRGTRPGGAEETEEDRRARELIYGIACKGGPGD